MLLELCDMPLKDWLDKVKDMTCDALEDILTFVLGIARGVQHLHSRQVGRRDSEL